jgi:hypothetical protein
VWKIEIMEGERLLMMVVGKDKSEGKNVQLIYPPLSTPANIPDLSLSAQITFHTPLHTFVLSAQLLHSFAQLLQKKGLVQQPLRASGEVKKGVSMFRHV